ncbi:hypothetical protein, partial [uncultured Gimesia sp.]|uniref:hypothetical protein n=1 Tax=uncultured Gimesia sp. TaxID=1678688 RepID=UPI00260EA90D
MLNRREFLAATGAGLLTTQTGLLAQQPKKKKRLAVVTTLWTYKSHAWHMAERFLHGYPIGGEWHESGLEVVSAYVDQRPDGDLSGQRSKEFGFPIYPTVAETLRCGGDKLNVDAVLLIGEHGDYPQNEFGQKLYPRYELFSKIAGVFRKDKVSVPVFNDKHLSWNFDYAKEMVNTSKELGFAFQAGSSLPVTWRMPSVDMPYGAEVTEAMGIASGPIDIYDFHAMEMIQSMLERRKGGETGVQEVMALRGPELWQALDGGQLPGGGWPPELFEACLSRSQTLAQPASFSHRYPTKEQIREKVKDPIYYWIKYRDGTIAHLLLLNGLVGDFTFAAQIKGRKKPLST